MDPHTKQWIDGLRDRREQLSQIDLINDLDIATRVQDSLRREIEDLEGLLHAKVAELDEVIRTWDHRASYSYRMDREEILRGLGIDVEEPERDTPKLNALMREPVFVFDDDHAGDPIEVAQAAHVAMGPTLEEMLLMGHDKALKAWVENLGPQETNIMQIMLPRLAGMLLEQAPEPVKMRYIETPEFVFRDTPVLNEADMRRIRTQHLVDLEPGTFDD